MKSNSLTLTFDHITCKSLGTIYYTVRATTVSLYQVGNYQAKVNNILQVENNIPHLLLRVKHTLICVFEKNQPYVLNITFSTSIRTKS